MTHLPRKRTSISLLALWFSVAALAACDRSAEQPPASVAGDGTAIAETGAGAPEPTAAGDRSVTRTVTADGRMVQPLQPQPLSFGAAGTITELLVEVGQPIDADEVVARIDTMPLELAVADARAAVAQAEAALGKLQNGSTVETARLDVERARNQLWGIQSQRDALCGAYERGQKEGGISKMAAPSSADCNGAQANVQAAEMSVQIAETQLQAVESSGPADLRSAQAALQRARLALANAEGNREEATLKAPFGGTVTAVHLRKGLNAGPGVPVVTLAPEGPLEFVTDNLSERDVAGVELAAPATITLTAFPDQPFSGMVGRIDAQGMPSSDGVVTFPAHIYIVDDVGLSIRAGMTGRVEIAVPEPDRGPADRQSRS